MSRATLIFNPNAGGSNGVEPQRLVASLSEAGYEVDYTPTEAPEELDPVLAGAEGAVVVAGGDGTFREVARRIRGSELPIALVPMGTANNIARSLGIEGSPVELIRRLRSPRTGAMDLGLVRGSWGEELFVEGAGLGFFANLLTAYQPEAGKSVVRALGVTLDALGGSTPVRCRVELDGEDLSGEFLMVEVMNTRAVGPRLALAPDADPSDGLLDIVCVGYSERENLVAYLRRLLAGELTELPSVKIRRGKCLRINWRDSAIHADAVTLADGRGRDKSYSAQFEVLGGALKLLLPGDG